MKKQYEKPIMAVEYYALTQAIAACGIEIPYMSTECIIQSSLPNEIKSLTYVYHYFLDGHCTEVPDTPSENDGLCYHTQMAGAFTS